MSGDSSGASLSGQLILIIVLTLLNAFFAAGEMAIVSVNKTSVEGKVKDGSKKYEIEIASSLVGGNYMYPYSKAQLEGVVLDVFSVKFLVYAVDYHKTGFAT